MRVLFIDPGGTTGWCIMDYDFDALLAPILVLSGETPGDRFPSTLRQLLNEQEVIDAVVYERFRIHKGTIGPSAEPVLKQIGRIEMVCEELGIPYSSQIPSSKSFFENRLRSFNMYQTGLQHARDAIQHGLFFFMESHKSRYNTTPAWVLSILSESDS